MSQRVRIVGPVELEHLLAGLNAAQEEAVTTPAAPLCIVAPAGSGKTRVLTRRIAYRVLNETADADRVLALTFTRKAAGELRSRLVALGVRGDVVAGTFHAVAYAQLRRRWADRGEREPALVQSKLRLLVPLLAGRSGDSAARAADVAAEIEWAKARMIPARQYEIEAARASRTPPLAPAAMSAVYERYEAEKRKRGVVDFDDLLCLFADAMATDQEFAAAQRWRFRHFFVDEFQDVNPVQFALLRAWLGGRRDLCVVGDPNQAIYSWNGADPRIIGGFERAFAGASVVALEDNYRSSPQILSVASAVLSDGPGRSPVIRAHRDDGPLPTVGSYASEIAEARAISTRVRRARRPGTAWSQIAVLVRTNAQTVVFEEAFRAADIPYRVRGGAFLTLPEVKAAIAHLRRTPRAVPLASQIADIEEMAAEEDEQERKASFDQLVRLGREYSALDPSASAAGFVAWMDATLRSEEPERDMDAVDILTFHRAKGLEWRTVFVAGLERGLVPIGRADGTDDLAEERRLLYVALTRAEAELHCSWAESRTFGDRAVRRSPSPWVATIEAACGALAGKPQEDWRPRLRRERKRLQSVPGTGGSGRELSAEQARVLDALKEWRSQAARAANVPAYVIFHDSTLVAVAEEQPRDRDALLRIPGLGPVKADRYGAHLLSVVEEHARGA